MTDYRYWPRMSGPSGTVAVLAAAMGGHVAHDPPACTVTVTVQQRDTWPELLGGSLSPLEVHRRVRVEARHAAWRRWSVRRLAAVTVVSVQHWPHPAHC